MKVLKKEVLPFLMLIVVIGAYFIFRNVKLTDAVFKDGDNYSSVKTDKESCLQCHAQMTGFSKYHDPNNIGCASCHLGDINSTDKDEAHKDMVLIPGNLSDAEKTCGKCHINELKKINTSLMTTNSGIVAVDKFIFGEADSPNYHYHIKDIQQSPADKHLRDLCANCHLGAEKKEFGGITELSRGGGCNACHLNYSESATKGLAEYLSSSKKELPKVHPSTDIFVKDEHCYGCHSRSSRISTNYQGWYETLLDEEDVVGDTNYKVAEDKRVYGFMGEDVHHAKGMLCIDCHSSHEVMGDGKTYTHEEDAVHVQCSDCHIKEKPNTLSYNELDTESSLVFLHRDYKHTDKQLLKVKKDGHPLVNTYLDEDGELYLLSKKDGTKHLIKKQPDVCARDVAHSNVTCAACHSQWTSRCIGCHNTFDKNDKGFDLLDRKDITGKWSEHVFEFSAERPALGVRKDSTGYTIEPAVPGMILTIDHQSFSGDVNDKTAFHRLYAPNSPHTTSKEVRDCKSCHANPMAIGYGKGTLLYKDGVWNFTPEYAQNPNDGLPEDAWVPFLEEPKAKVLSTRTNFKPFTVDQQKRILLVGACLQCHKDDSKVMQQTLYEGLDVVLKNISKQCILPKQ
ncbi:MAG: hypothetical protein KDC74_04130 [Flavobacteriaceae bacterium]|nr:hypothetical protein [Flavobacteriaceae bacterium]